MKILAFLLAFIFLIAGASAAGTLPPVKQGDCAQLIETCGNCTFVNITTIRYSNQTLQVFNQPMTQTSPGSYNYSICSTAGLRELIYMTIKDPDGIKKVAGMFISRRNGATNVMCSLNPSSKVRATFKRSLHKLDFSNKLLSETTS